MTTTRTHSSRRRALASAGRVKSKTEAKSSPASARLPLDPAGTDGAPPSLRQLAHDLANALGGARLRVALIRASENTTIDAQNLDALERLLNQACAIEEALHASIRPLFPKSRPGAADRPASNTRPPAAKRRR